VHAQPFTIGKSTLGFAQELTLYQTLLSFLLECQEEDWVLVTESVVKLVLSKASSFE